MKIFDIPPRRLESYAANRIGWRSYCHGGASKWSINIINACDSVEKNYTGSSKTSKWHQKTEGLPVPSVARSALPISVFRATYKHISAKEMEPSPLHDSDM